MSLFAELKSFMDLPLAELARAKLESERVYCFLHSKHHFSLKWSLANALGGVRLYVHRDDVVKARNILETDESDLLYQQLETSLPAHQEDLCAHCGSEDFEYIQRRRISAALTMLLGIPLIFWGTYSKCRHCGWRSIS